MLYVKFVIYWFCFSGVMFLHHSKTVPHLWRNRLEEGMKQLSVHRHSFYLMLNL